MSGCSSQTLHRSVQPKRAIAAELMAKCPRPPSGCCRRRIGKQELPAAATALAALNADASAARAAGKLGDSQLSRIRAVAATVASRPDSRDLPDQHPPTPTVTPTPSAQPGKSKNTGRDTDRGD
jgi:hypothetical protein